MGWCRARQRLRVRRVHARRGDMGAELRAGDALSARGSSLATDVADHAEIIPDGVTGFLADAPTPNSMATASSASGPGAPKPSDRNGGL